MVEYISPNIEREEYERKVDTMMRKNGGTAVIIGDFNAKSQLWGAGQQDARGEYLADGVSRWI